MRAIFALPFAVLALVSVSPAHATKTICSMTLNSSDEIEVFRKNLANDSSGEDFKFVELVPSSKDPNWFRNACASGVKCDALLISGHFGGLFFGEQSSSTIGMSEMADASCSNSCAGILDSPKEVFLMGCNTLATQKRDHRTSEQYLNVLVGDGVPLNFAEQVVSSRYSQQGFSLEKRFSAIFPKVKKLYGFSSTGPLGAQAAPRLTRYLKAIGSYAKHLDTMTTAPNTAITQAFAGTSFQETVPATTLDATSRGLYCALRSTNDQDKAAAVQTIAQTGAMTGFFDSLASQLGDLRANMQGRFDAGVRATLQKNLAQISANNRTFITIQHQVLKVSAAFGLITPDEKLAKLNALLDDAYAQTLDYSKVSQICDIVRDEPRVAMPDEKTLYRLSKSSPYFMLSLGCYKTLGADAKKFLLDKIVRPLRGSERTIALQVMKNYWTQADTPWLQDVIAHGDSAFNMRLYLSAQKVLYAVRTGILGTGGALAACVLDSENGGGKNIGTNWSCLTNNTGALSADVCDHFASLNPDPENSDDMRWFCWAKRPAYFLGSRPECYLLGDTMNILGNKMKQVWNCTAR